ncbi:hypothetical protein V6C21_09180 [[Clostridium] cellulosi]
MKLSASGAALAFYRSQPENRRKALNFGQKTLSAGLFGFILFNFFVAEPHTQHALLQYGEK